MKHVKSYSDRESLSESKLFSFGNLYLNRTKTGREKDTHGRTECKNRGNRHREAITVVQENHNTLAEKVLINETMLSEIKIKKHR